jgi:hypothetical protein
MKIGELDFKDFALEKPLFVTSGGKFLTAKDIISEPGATLGSLLTLSKNDQITLAVERYKLEPDFRLGIIGVGLLTKDEIIDHIRNQDTFGQTALEAEIDYCGELVSNLQTKPGIERKVPVKPIPVIPDWKEVKKCIIIKLRNRALFCENTTDGVTSPFAAYRAANVHPVFARRGFTVIVLDGTNDTRTNFIPQAKNGLTVYISGVGHGAYTLYTGHAGNRILEVGTYDPAEVKNKGLHFLSCQTAKTLGPDTIAKGAKFYAGYDENFHLVWDDQGTTHVNEFQCFAEADSTFDISIANGATAIQAYNATYNSFNLQMVKPQIPGTVTASWLKYDRDHLRLWGKQDTVILPYRFVRICFPIKSLEYENALSEAGELVDKE